MKTKYVGINWRSFISIYMIFSFVIMTITGIILYISPPGRIAHWSNWLLLGITKEDWQSLHTLFSFIWIVAMVFHLIFNWKPIVSYIRKKVEGRNRIKIELVLAAALSFIVFFGTYFQVRPFNYVMEFGEYMTASWSNDETEPPVPHAELLTVNEFSKTIGISTSGFLAVMERNGYFISDTSITIQSLGKKFNIAPSFIYNLFKENLPEIKNAYSFSISSTVEGSGYGRRKISELFKEKNLSWSEGTKIYKERGIIISEDDKIKNIAEKNNILPIDLIKMLGTSEI